MRPSEPEMDVEAPPFELEHLGAQRADEFSEPPPTQNGIERLMAIFIGFFPPPVP